MSLSAVPSDPAADPPAVGLVPDPTLVVGALRAEVESVVRGKPDVVRLALCALLAGEHLLVEDVPGTGKTVLARSLAAALGGRFRRVQCTPDLLPSDLTGTTVYDSASGTWSFRAGPVFANVVLVDELNRASPRTQAALLEPMEEGSVTVDGTTHRLPVPSLVIATQNPFGSAGTFALPESQLDRFGFVLSMGLPDRAAQRALLRGEGGTAALDSVRAVTTPADLSATIASVASVHVADAVLDYLLDLVESTRRHAAIVLGASPRAADSLLRLARAHAVVAGRRFVSPDDVQAVFVPALAHRVVTLEGTAIASGARALSELLGAIAVPTP
jgi:MoxR-like ATPase